METCIVGCKLPHGLKINLPGVDKPVTLKGRNSSRIIGGYGLTPGVPKEAFTEWLVSHSWAEYVKNGSVFMEDNEKRARDKAKEMRTERTGMEPIDPLKGRPGLVVEDVDKKKLAEARAANPDRNRSIDELDAA